MSGDTDRLYRYGTIRFTPDTRVDDIETLMTTFRQMWHTEADLNLRDGKITLWRVE